MRKPLYANHANRNPKHTSRHDENGSRKKKKKENGSRNNNKGRGKMEMLAVSALSTRDSTSQGQFKSIRLYHESKKTYIRRSGKFSMEHLKQTYGYESRDGG